MIGVGQPPKAWFVERTTVVDYTGFEGEIVDTSFFRSAFSVQCEDKAALTVNASLTVATVRVGGAEPRNSCATTLGVGLSSEIISADTLVLVVAGDADRIGTALEPLAGVLA